MAFAYGAQKRAILVGEGEFRTARAKSKRDPSKGSGTVVDSNDVITSGKALFSTEFVRQGRTAVKSCINISVLRSNRVKFGSCVCCLSRKKSNDLNIFHFRPTTDFHAVLYFSRSPAFSRLERKEPNTSTQSDGADFDGIFFVVMPPGSKWQRICHQQHTG